MKGLHTIQSALYFITLAVTILASIYGVTSWCILKKFRNYRNYVCLTLILIHVTYDSSGEIAYYVVDVNSRDRSIIWYIYIRIWMYLSTVRIYWSVVMCHMFYVDIVKVFNGHIQRRYLKSCIFGWGVPLVTTPIYIFAQIHINFYAGFLIAVSPLMLNVFLFITTVCSLCRSSNASTPTATNKCRRLYIAVVIFILGDITLLSVYVAHIFEPITSSDGFILMLRSIYYLQPILLSVYLIVVKSNRELWRDFFVTKLIPSFRARHVDHDREPADSGPQVLDTQV